MLPELWLATWAPWTTLPSASNAGGVAVLESVCRPSYTVPRASIRNW
jgi:hypothetical protein